MALIPRGALRARVLPRFPANLIAGNGISIIKDGQKYTLAVQEGFLLDGNKGDITVDQGGILWTINDGAVTAAKLQSVPQSSFFGRSGAGTGPAQILSSIDATAQLQVFGPALKGLVPASGGGIANFLRADGAWMPTSAYTEGIWAPGITFQTPGNIAVTYGNRIGNWSRTGNIVLARGTITTTTFTHSTAAGRFVIDGLPFPAVAQLVTTGAVLMQGWSKAGYTQLVPYTSAAGGSIMFIGTSGPGVPILDLGVADVPSGGAIILVFSLVYNTV